MLHSKSPQQPFIAVVGACRSHPSGIASYTRELATSIAEEVYGRPLGAGGRVDLFAVTEREVTTHPPTDEAHGTPVTLEIRQQHKADYRHAADVLNHSRTQVVLLQHDFRLYGGPDGSHLLELLHQLDKPLISTFHDVVQDPNRRQRSLLRRIAQRSLRVVVLTTDAAHRLASDYGVEPERIDVIPHGVPDAVPVENSLAKQRWGFASRPLIVSPGSLRPEKGLETILHALPMVTREYPDVLYLIVGPSAPRDARAESYRHSLESSVLSLGLHRNVLLKHSSLDRTELSEVLNAADLVALPRRSQTGSVSRVLAYAVATGRPVLTTPSPQAVELLGDESECILDSWDSRIWARNITALLADPGRCQELHRSEYERSREFVWPRVAERYVEVAQGVAEESVASASEVASGLRMRVSVPQLRFDHLFSLTDDTGLLHRSRYAVAERRHGYSTGDNAEALIVTNMAWSIFRDESVLPYLSRYFAFLSDAFDENLARFRSRLSYQRHWSAETEDECQGRALWALGHIAAHGPSSSLMDLALDLLERSVATSLEGRSPRGWAFAVLGLSQVCEAGAHDFALEPLGTLAARLLEFHQANASSEWPWFERDLERDNGRLPQALLRAGRALQNDEMINRGLTALEWLLQQLTDENGVILLPGENQQSPVECAALIGACRVAYEVTAESRWLEAVESSFQWFLGRNSAGEWLVDFRTRGCHDALTVTGVDPNQSAEATLSWLLALLNLHEVQSTVWLEGAHETLPIESPELQGDVQ